MAEKKLQNDPRTQKLFYKATDPASGNMWDVWLFHHENTYYLFSLCSSGENWDNFSMARSPDGVHWTEIGPVIARDEGVTWMGTGSVWKNPVPGAKPSFLINYSSWKGPRQTIFFAGSDDLVHWTKCGPEREFIQDERWYEATGRWDCIWTIERTGGGLYGYWTATPKPETGGRFGFGESPDGITWEALEPPKVNGVGNGEVGAIEKIGGRYVMLFGTEGHMEALVADRPQGPFEVIGKNRVFLGGHTYFARFFPSPSGMLVCHHSIARDRQVSFGLLKAADMDAEGTFRLKWWRGNDAAKSDAVAVEPPAAGAEGPIAMFGNRFDAVSGFILEGTFSPPSGLGAPRGLYVEHGERFGNVVLFHETGRAEFGTVAADGSGFVPEHSVSREVGFESAALVRLVLKGVLMEVYLDDYLVECYSLPSPASGRIGIVHGGDRRSFGSPRAWR